MRKYIQNGKVKKCAVLPNGIYIYAVGAEVPERVNPDYDGFKMVFEREARVERSTSGQVIVDSMPPIKSMVDGKTYDSKTAYYASLKAQDSHIVEKGEQNLDKRSSEVKGDFGCRKELREALHQHLPHLR